jgi:hypothetical protein
MDPLWADQGRPVEVFFDGFRSDTFTLWKAGWNLVIEKEYGLRENILCIFRKEDTALYGQGISHDNRNLEVIYINKAALKSTTPILISGSLDFRNVDLSPSGMFQKRNLWEEPYFRDLVPVKEDLIVDPLTIDQMLEEIRRQQAPKQKEIRARKIYAHLSVAV